MLPVGEASDLPPQARASFDVVLRHLIWTLPDPHMALHRLTRLLRPGGQLILISSPDFPHVSRTLSRGRPVTAVDSRTTRKRPATAFPLVPGRLSWVAAPGFEPG
jgi:ubiquinone/menaquinone biosynthesis C-methylase UbiE